VKARTVVVVNRQRVRRVDTRWLQGCAVALLEGLLGLEEYELGVQLVGAGEMARVNEGFLGHRGSTDVITFSHAEAGEERLHGELFISVADAVAQAEEWGTTWQAEVVRYLVHGVLHLRGYDDLEAGRRRVMKRVENRLVGRLAKRFALSKLERKPRVGG
jgi:rRNA maturation RNase YbeY